MRLFSYVFATGLLLMGASAFASGEDTYKAVCANCHSKAFANSPQMG
jgi:cytochrome c5